MDGMDEMDGMDGMDGMEKGLTRTLEQTAEAEKQPHEQH